MSVNMDGRGRGRDSSLWYKILLGLLSLTVLGLTIGIIAINVSRNNNEPSSSYSLPDELTGDNLSPEDQVMKEVAIMLQTPGVKTEEVEKYYDEVINKANEDGDYYFAMDIITQKVLYLVVDEGDCERAKEYSEKVDVSKYSDEEKGYLQSYLYSVLLGCDDTEESN